MSVPLPTAAQRDEEFAAAVASALADDVARVLAEDPGEAARLAHRPLAARVRALVVASVLGVGGSAEELLTRALPLLAALRARQNPSGLFAGGDNVDSPPDSAFSINDLADAALLLDRWDAPAGAPASAAARVREGLAELLDALTPPLLVGGVHTPNHRWELSAALGRLLRLSPPEPTASALRTRIGQWLAEGVDVDADGLFSERSANYAAAVSDPSLLLLADVLDRPDLLAVVESSLDALLDLLLPDGAVETVHSRRQDQRRSDFPLAAFAVPLRAVAVATGRGDLAWAARRAVAQGLHAAGSHDDLDGAAAAAALLLDPRVGSPLPADAPPPTRRRRTFGCGLVVDHRPGAAVVVAANSDHAEHRRICSGLAVNPTVLRALAGRAVLDSVRLSRTFFGLGPFRPADLGQGGETLHLREEVSAAYYQPLAPPLLDADGVYAVQDDGRFSAAMAFAQRERDEVRLTTSVDVLLTDGGAELVVDVVSAPAGPSVDWLLELALRPEADGRLGAGSAEQFVALPDGRHLLAGEPGAVATWTVGDDALRVEVVEASGALTAAGATAAPGGVAAYEPGEDYGHLGGTDAMGARGSELLVLAGSTPSRLRLRVELMPGFRTGDHELAQRP
ncbi:hypothetical protein [Quadrisphaera setariae]|uniref:Heparinase II/III-like protein n=1 Tax=Quadrisphaera setariae TaxID=2593304 RepID=A0A5C8ZF14_9ACTN|nr:hypothetical protein [Quadrisphaera setariae]TXR55506.1 hypothetical protein FMM08_14455 [Quadrisphaera setariae]